MRLPAPPSPAVVSTAQHRHAFRWNAYAQAVAAGGQVAITLLLVRLLPPAELGRVALVYLVFGLLALLDEGSFATRLVSRDERAPAQLDAILYREVLIGLALAAGVAAAAPALAALYGQPDLAAYLLALAPVFAISGPRRFYQAVFQRDLAFRGAGIVRMAAAATYLAVAVVFALRGHGVWSLVYGLVARATIESVGFCAVGWARHRPGRFRPLRWRTGYGRPGVAKVGERVLAYLLERADIVVIGKALGPGALGVYDAFKRLGIGFYQQVIPMFSRVAIPRLARYSARPAALSRFYLQQLGYIVHLLFPAYAFQAVFARPLVRWVFGAEWLVYAPVFAWLSVLLLIRSTSGPIDALLTARGLVRRELVYTVALACLLVATLLHAVAGGLEATVVAVSLLQLGLTVPIYVWVVRPAARVRTGAYFAALVRPAVGAFGAAALAFACTSAWPLSLGARLALGVALTASLFAGFTVATRARLRRRAARYFRRA